MKQIVQAGSSFLWKEPKENKVLAKIKAFPLEALHTFLTDEDTMRLYQESLVDSEVLYGTIVEVITQTDGWSHVIVLDQKSNKHPLGYPGYLPNEVLKPLPPDYATAKRRIGVIAKEAVLVFDSTTRLVSFGTVLPLVGETADSYQVATPNGLATIAKAFAHVLSDTWEKLPEKIIALAEQFINQPYVWAGISGSGFDCSGFMYSLHRLHGILIPRDTIEQAQQANIVPYSQAQPGDLLLFAYEEGKGEVHHVGLYLGDDEMIHSRTPGSRVMKTKIAGSNYEPELAVVARYWQDKPNTPIEPGT